MIENKDHKIEFKDKLISFYNVNKLKIYIFITFSIIAIFVAIFLKINNFQKNTLISDKYIKAGLYFANGDIENSKKLYEEIILSKNKFYSTLALNNILEKDFNITEKKLLNFFEIVIKSNKSEESRDLIFFKKALYLIKNSKIQEGNDILKTLIKKESKLKDLAQITIDE
jgi:hypothetical protein